VKSAAGQPLHSVVGPILNPTPGVVARASGNGSPTHARSRIQVRHIDTHMLMAYVLVSNWMMD
jgi:hypothetical protein